MNGNGWGITISCDDCRMQCTSACDDCVVSFLLRDDEQQTEHEPLVLDLDQVRVVRLLGKAGLVPDLRYDVAS
ncbi:MAG: hypothetical protein KDB37_09740 [Ilumatobacter sp.]|nr:hypothetical protein [Ilumatobacter sp.]